MSVGSDYFCTWLSCSKGRRLFHTLNLSIIYANPFSTDFLEALPRACQRATATDWEILHSTLPNIIYEAVDMKTKMSASDIPQSAEIEISDSASVADEDVDTVILYAPQLQLALSLALTTLIQRRRSHRVREKYCTVMQSIEISPQLIAYAV